MRKIIFFLSFITLSTATAGTCADLTGLYQMTEGAVVKFENEGCNRLIRWSGFTTKKGEIVISPEKMVYVLNGTALCTGERCQSALAMADGIHFTLNYDGYVKTKEHGLCIHRELKTSVNNDNNLQNEYQVHDCDDGYSGSTTRTFPRINQPLEQIPST